MSDVCSVSFCAVHHGVVDQICASEMIAPTIENQTSTISCPPDAGVVRISSTCPVLIAIGPAPDALKGQAVMVNGRELLSCRVGDKVAIASAYGSTEHSHEDVLALCISAIEEMKAAAERMGRS